MKSKLFPFILMHAGFFLYAFYPVLGKAASKYEFLSFNYCVIYCVIIALLFVYAVLWQQVLKTFRLPIAICNKAVTIVWGMFLSRLIFAEEITLKKILGAAIILCGIILLSVADKKSSQGEPK